VAERGERGQWNFGPENASLKTVGDVVDLAKELWGPTANWNYTPEENAPHEDNFLFLDSSKAQEALGWRNLLSLHQSISETIDWEKQVLTNGNALEVSRKAVQGFLGLTN
jgi:CDP-glucose 4,6-dehydratase